MIRVWGCFDGIRGLTLDLDGNEKEKSRFESRKKGRISVLNFKTY